MSDLLLAVPWWLFATLILVGGAVFWSGNNRQQKGPKYVGIALILLALLLKTISFFVETDKEKVERQTKEMVKAVQTRDWTTFASMLDPDVCLDVSTGTVFTNSKMLVEGAKLDCEKYNLTNVSARVTDVEQDPGGITVDLDTSSDMTVMMGMSATVPSSWKLVWDRTGKDWRLHEVTCLRIGQEKPEDMAREIGAR